MENLVGVLVAAGTTYSLVLLVCDAANGLRRWWKGDQ